jgi:hypothetical protein
MLVVGPAIAVSYATPAGAAVTQNANDESSLRSAFGDSSVDTVNVTADITVDGCSPGSVSRNSSNPVVVEGNGFTITRDNGDCDKRIFKSDGDVTVQDITLTGGRAHGAGGAIESDGDVTVTNSTITDNQALWCSYMAPTVKSDGATVTESDEEVSATFYCRPYGGGVFAEGSVTVTGSTFTNNVADDTGGGFASEGHATVTGSTFSNNVAGGNELLATAALAPLTSVGCLCSGGGFAATDFNADVTGSTFTNNSLSCLGCGGKGGGIYVEGTIALSTARVTGNSLGCEGCGGEGGGVYAGGSATVSSSTLSSNSASCDGCAGEGGGLFTGSQLINNLGVQGSTQGFGAFVQQIQDPGTVEIDHSTFDANSTSCDFCGGDGGGAYGDSPTSFTVSYSTFSNNTAAWAGGAFSTGSDCGECGTAVVVINSTVTGNTSSGFDGAIDATGSGDTLQLVYDTIDSNTLANAELQNATVQSNDEDPAANVSANELRSFGTDVTHPIGAVNCFVDAGTTTSDGYNYTDDNSCGFGASTDSQLSTNDPLLAALADNGGPTQTMLPQSGSPLIDNIALVDCGFNSVTDDQRAVTRPQIHGCDTGAVEVVGAGVNVFKTVTGTQGNPVPSAGYTYDVACTDGTTGQVTVADATAGGTSGTIGNILPGSTCTVTEERVVYTLPTITGQPTVTPNPATTAALAEGATATVAINNDYSSINLLGEVVLQPRFAG